MKINEYQELALKTLNKDLDQRNVLLSELKY